MGVILARICDLCHRSGHNVITAVSTAAWRADVLSLPFLSGCTRWAAKRPVRCGAAGPSAARPGIGARRRPGSLCGTGLDRLAVPAWIALRRRPGSLCGTGLDRLAAPRGTASGAARMAFRRSRDRRAARACAAAPRPRGLRRGCERLQAARPLLAGSDSLARFLPGSCPVLAGPGTQRHCGSRGFRFPHGSRREKRLSSAAVHRVNP
jgi:hypothetical protein